MSDSYSSRWSSRRPKIHLQPVNWVQRIALYVTQSRYYLVGSNNTQTAFKVLKVDRTDNDLNIVDDRIEYSYHEIRDLLIRIDHGNRTTSNSTGVSKTVSSFGLIGFVKFLHGYYLILIIKRRKVASIGYHTIYKVEETKLVYIPNEQPKEFINEETRYVRAFNSIDLTSNFYFSYSYDVSRTLQYNLSPIMGKKFFQDNNRGVIRSAFQSQSEEEGTGPGETTIRISHNLIDKNHNLKFPNSSEKMPPILVKTEPNDRFVWNSHLIDFQNLHDDWKVNLIHGFVAQANICVYSKSIYITIIARRSKRYCGTRFLKRGLNLDGDSANEVETEQIVHDASVSNFSKGFFTSFVQMRGSLPDRWSQDATKIVPKPPIMQDFVDPYHEATAKHFNILLKRYGTPVVVLNLIKQKEKKIHESVLNRMLNQSVEYLNQFLPQQHVIRLMSFDMARCNKSRNENVMKRLGKIGFNIVRVTGIFQSWRSARRSNYDNTYTLHLRQRTFNRKPSSSRIGGYRLRNGQCLQNGVVRVNCVDSLDRTNTAQFVLGKVALAFQLQALGVLIEPSLEYDTDAVRLLEQLYEDHGDTIALQYGGSQLVHRVKTYRKVAPITSHSSEIMQTLSRYYSNTFSDAEKQNVINIFLGVRKALRINVQAILNNLATDYYLHNQLLLEPFDLANRKKSYKQWWDRNLLRSLPRSYEEFEKEATCYALEVRQGSSTLEERIDYFGDAYRPYEVTYLATSFSLQILHTIKDFMPIGAVHHSPFCLRLGPGKLKEKYLRMPSNKKLPPNPSVYGLPSTSSSASELSILDDSELSDDGSNEMDDLSTHPTAMNTSLMMLNPTSRIPHENFASKRYLSDEDILSTGTERRNDYYGCMVMPISVDDFKLYKNYSLIGKASDLAYRIRNSQNNIDVKFPEVPLAPSYQKFVVPDLKNGSVADSFGVQNFSISREELNLYENYVSLSQFVY